MTDRDNLKSVEPGKTAAEMIAEAFAKARIQIQKEIEQAEAIITLKKDELKALKKQLSKLPE